MTNLNEQTTSVGVSDGPTSEFSLFFNVKAGHAEQLRDDLRGLQNYPGYRPGEHNMAIATIHEARFVLFDEDTRMPAAMHAFYLRNFYVENKLAAGELEIGGRVIDLSVIKAPTYVVSAINDHIVPWESAYKTLGLVSGPTRFVLGSGGHIAGIVSPPGPKAWHMVSADNEHPATGAEWRKIAERKAGTWWEDWAVWSDGNSGPMIKPPATGSKAHPVLGDGPGDYVRT